MIDIIETKTIKTAIKRVESLELQKKLKSFISKRLISLKCNTSLNLYFIAFIILSIIYLGLVFKINLITNNENILSIIMILLFFIAACLDLIYISKKLWNVFIGKVLVVLGSFITYTVSYSHAKKLIYYHTGINPDNFDVAVHFFTGFSTIFFIPIFILFFITAIVFLGASVWFILKIIEFILSELFRITIGNFTGKYFDINIVDYTSIKVGSLLLNEKITSEKFRKFLLHCLLFLFGFISFGFIVTEYFVEPIYQFQKTKYMKSAIVKLSFYKAKENTCKNTHNKLIKLLDDNNVAIANFNEELNEYKIIVQKCDK